MSTSSTPGQRGGPYWAPGMPQPYYGYSPYHHYYYPPQQTPKTSSAKKPSSATSDGSAKETSPVLSPKSPKHAHDGGAGGAPMSATKKRKTNIKTEEPISPEEKDTEEPSPVTKNEVEKASAPALSAQ